MRVFRVQEFARLAGVTVRALHHYDRMKLLSPGQRSEGGYRLYCHEDLGRLERILVLRYLGLPLREIAELLDSAEGRSADARGAESLRVTLARQRAALEERRAGLNRVLRAIEHAERRAQEEPREQEWTLYQSILKEIQMQEATDWTERYYSPKAAEVLRERRAALTAEEMAGLGAQWQEVFAEAQRLVEGGVSPDSAEGRALVGRWMRLADEMTLGNPEVGEGFRRMYEDESHWPDDERAARLREGMPKAEHREFFHRAVQACLRHG